jgi:adenylate cyclase
VTTEGGKRKLTAIMSADVKGYSRLMSNDEAATIKSELPILINLQIDPS